MSAARWMRLALSLAERGLGTTWPNPSVGCVLVKDGAPVGIGWTQPGGRPHAETMALQQAGEAACGATAYVTLEPCAHHGHTPPCVEALIAAGIAEVVVAVEDPDPRVSGKGLARLREAGLRVTTGVMEQEAAALNAGFFLRVREHRPFVSVKCATSLDGRVATSSGESQWITGAAARRHAHGLRARYDAILVGVGTVLADDPLLTCRLPGLVDRSPVRVVLDRQLRMGQKQGSGFGIQDSEIPHPSLSQRERGPEGGPLSANHADRMRDGCIRFPLPLGEGGVREPALLRTARDTPLWILCEAGACEERQAVLAAHGARVIRMEAVTIPAVLALLAEEGITRLLVEGGPTIATAFLNADPACVDRLYWYRAPLLLGGDGKPAFHGLPVETLSAAPRYRLQERMSLGEDACEVWDAPVTLAPSRG